MRYAKECLYDVNWQTLRVAMLGHSGSMYWEDSLREYAGDGSDADATERAWRVLNLCNATLLAYGSRSDFEDGRRQCVKKLQSDMQSMGAIVFRSNWDWDKVALDLEELHHENWLVFKSIRQDLLKRVGTSKRKAKERGDKDNADGFKHRSELEHFLFLMESVINDSPYA